MPASKPASMQFGTRILSSLGAGLLLATLGSVAHAQNLNFLNNTPAAYMKQADNASLAKAVREAVDQKQDGETTTWTNEGLRNSVKIDAAITLTKTETTGDTTCRDTQVVVNAKGQSMTLRPRFCRQGTGAWVYQKTH
jgi:surface antigen